MNLSVQLMTDGKVPVKPKANGFLADDLSGRFPSVYPDGVSEEATVVKGVKSFPVGSVAVDSAHRRSDVFASVPPNRSKIPTTTTNNSSLNAVTNSLGIDQDFERPVKIWNMTKKHSNIPIIITKINGTLLKILKTSRSVRMATDSSELDNSTQFNQVRAGPSNKFPINLILDMSSEYLVGITSKTRWTASLKLFTEYDALVPENLSGIGMVSEMTYCTGGCWKLL